MPTLESPLTKAEAIALMKSAFGKEVRRTAVDYVAPFLWSFPTDRGDRDARNGSAFIVKGDNRLFLVTARHVFERFKLAKEHFGPAVRCQICNVGFDPEQRLIDTDPALDISTFEFSEEEAQRTGKTVMSFQPLVPEWGKGVFFAGFPGRERRRLDARTIESGVFTGWTVAASVSERQISGRLDRDFQIDLEGQITIPPGYDIGGVSGAPLMTVVQSEHLWSWRLGGIMTEFSRNLEIFFATRADFIRPDGTLLRD